MTTRITIEEDGIKLEHSIQREAGLTREEEREMDSLKKELESTGFSDFQKAELLEDKARADLMTKKKRYETLKQWYNEGRVEFVAVPLAQMPTSVMLIAVKGKPADYVENMPQWMIDKIVTATLNPVINLSVTAPAAVAQPQPQDTRSLPQAQPPNKMQRITSVIQSVKAVWKTQRKDGTSIQSALELVDIYEQGGKFIVMPRRFLGSDWTPINEKLREAFGDHWIRLNGDQKKESHWEYAEADIK